MTTLQAVIRLQEIKEILNRKGFSTKSYMALKNEFILIKDILLHSQFTFTPITSLIDDVEKKLEIK